MTEDEKQALIIREAALAIGEWLQGANILQKPVRALAIAELEAMAAAAISSAITTRSRLPKETDVSEVVSIQA